MTKVLLSAVAALILAAGALAQPQTGAAPATTAITVTEMHCAGCAQRIGKKIYEVQGVAAVHFDLEKKLLLVTPQPAQAPSPRKLWEAVEKGGDRPVLLQGPGGTFKTKPQS